MRNCSDNLNVVCLFFNALAFAEDGKRMNFLDQVKHSVLYRSVSPLICFYWPPIFLFNDDFFLDLEFAFNQEINIVAGS